MSEASSIGAGVVSVKDESHVLLSELLGPPTDGISFTESLQTQHAAGSSVTEVCIKEELDDIQDCWPEKQTYDKEGKISKSRENQNRRFVSTPVKPSESQMSMRKLDGCNLPDQMKGLDFQKWVTHETADLLELIMEHRLLAMLDKKRQRNKQIYEQLEAHMTARGHNFTWSQLRDRFKYLKKRYWEVKKAVKQSGEGKCWAHFEQMDLLMRDRPRARALESAGSESFIPEVATVQEIAQPLEPAVNEPKEPVAAEGHPAAESETLNSNEAPSSSRTSSTCAACGCSSVQKFRKRKRGSNFMMPEDPFIKAMKEEGEKDRQQMTHLFGMLTDTLKECLQK